MAGPLTQLEQRVYHYMIDFLAENTYQPSIREIARQFHIRSTKTVSDLLHSLERKGFIAREEARSRGVRLLGFAAAGTTQPVPCYADIGPDDPVLREENRRAFVTMDRRFLPAEDVFCLTAKGDSMAGRGILSGDYVMISPSVRPKDGDIVAARVGPSAAFRTLALRDSAAVLRSENDSEREVEIGTSSDVSLLGVVCGVFRPFYERSASAILPREDTPQIS